MNQSTQSPLWYAIGFLSGPVIWAVHFLVIYVLGEFGCNDNYAEENAWVEIAIIGATVVAVLITAGSGWLAYNRWQLTGISEREHFMAFVGVGLNLLFSLAIVASIIPIFFLSTCSSVTG